MKNLVEEWFDKWRSGNYLNLPIAQNFKHTSPFGTIDGKEEYLNLVKENEDKFLGYEFIIHNSLFSDDNACVRYTAKQGDFQLEVSEWYFFKNNLIDSIVSYYHIGEIRDDRKLKSV